MSTSDQQRIFGALQQIRSVVEKIAYNESASKRAFDTLYQELEQYKSEYVIKMEKGILLDLLSFFDSLLWFQSTVNEQPENTADNLNYLIDEFLELLLRRDVIPHPPIETFHPKYHRAIQTVDTNDPEQDGKIHKILRRGFLRGSRNLRDEEVVLYRYRKSSPNKLPSPKHYTEAEEESEEEISEEESSRPTEQVSIQLNPTSVDNNDQEKEPLSEEKTSEADSVEDNVE